MFERKKLREIETFAFGRVQNYLYVEEHETHNEYGRGWSEEWILKHGSRFIGFVGLENCMSCSTQWMLSVLLACMRSDESLHRLL
jgi:hypothetical protein